jgi:hypothetical protein
MWPVLMCVQLGEWTHPDELSPSASAAPLEAAAPIDARMVWVLRGLTALLTALLSVLLVLFVALDNVRDQRGGACSVAPGSPMLQMIDPLTQNTPAPFTAICTGTGTD